IQPYGTDALRFTLTSLASTGRDINWDMKRLEGYRNFCNKIWNASRYVLSSTEQFDSQEEATYSVADHWIQHELQLCIAKVNSAIEQYRFDLASQALYEFIWNEFCDWYLELSKPTLNAGGSDANGTRHTLLSVLESVLRLAHPFMPFITEEVWQMLPSHCKDKAANDSSIMLQAYPIHDDSLNNDTARQEVSWLKAIVTALRNIRGELNISPAKTIKVILNKGTSLDQERLSRNHSLLSSLAKLDSIEFLANGEAIPTSSMQLADELEILVPIKGLIDLDAEVARLNQEISKVQKEQQRLNGKLSNEKFLANAPSEVVAQEQEKLAKIHQALETLENKRTELEQL
ncbi:MAG: class I tRNA ligase family protein, partial [Pseudomonadota bacterium]